MKPVLLICVLVAATAGSVSAQVPLPPDHLADAISALNSSDTQRPLPCDVRIVDPHLGFDFRFQAGYEAGISLKHYSGANDFSALTRITPLEPSLQPAYFTQSLAAADIPVKNKAQITLVGGYFLGEGKYNVDFLLTDQDGRTCRKQWQIDARRSSSDRALPFAVEAGTVLPYTFENWKGITERNARAEHSLRVTVLLHAHAISRRAVKLRTSDQEMLLGSLASLMAQMPNAQIKVIAFNLDQQLEFYRDADFSRDSWDPLLEALENLQLGTVSYKVLANPTGYLNLIAKLVNEEQKERPDAVVFLGPPARQLEKPLAALAHAGAGQPQFFYFEYDPYWYPFTEFSDSLYYTTRALMGRVFRVRSPSEFAAAIEALQTAVEPAKASAVATR